MAKKKGRLPKAPEPYTPPRGRHTHRCGRCGTVWEHTDACRLLPDLELDAAHTCPACGVEEFLIYDGEKSPSIHDHHEEKKS